MVKKGQRQQYQTSCHDIAHIDARLKVSQRESDTGDAGVSSASTFTTEAEWFAPTQNATGVVRLSTHVRRPLVNLGIGYSMNSPVLVSSRSVLSANSVVTQRWSFLSMATEYGK